MCDARREPIGEVDPCDEFGVAMERFVARTSPPDATPVDREEDLRREQRLIDRLQLDFARRAARAVADGVWDQMGSTSPIGWLTNACSMTPGGAGAAICVGEHADGLERSVDSMQRGTIGFAHLTLVARTKAAVEASGATLDEARLLRRAEVQTPHQFRKACAHARHAADADAFRRAEKDSAESRFLAFYTVAHDEDGVWVRGRFDSAGAATLHAALEPLARRLGPDDHREREARWADALLEMANYTLRTGGEGATSCQVPHLQVTTTLETLMGTPGAPGGEVEGTVVSSATVQQLTCSANVRRLLLGPDSLVADVGRMRRVPCAATRIKLEHRDQGCVWPRCGRKVRWVEPHHIVHWAQGGATDIDNLVLLCWKHHGDLHLRGWQVVRVPGQREVLAIPPLSEPDPLNRGPSYREAA